MNRRSLTAELVAIRDHYHTMNHPFFTEWANGRLNKRQMGYYLIQHAKMTCDGLRAYGLGYVKSPPDVQRHILENLAEETGAKGLSEESEAVDHTNLIGLWTSECGYTEAEIAAIELVPGAEAVRHCWMHVAYHYPWPVFLACMTVLESQEVGIQSRVIPALYKHYGYAKGHPAIHFFEEHYEADQIHGQRNFQFFDELVHDDEVRRTCAEHAQAICKLRWQYMNDIHRFSVLGEDEKLPPRRPIAL